MKKNNRSYKGLIDLAQPRLGSKVIYKTDEFFGSAKRLISPEKPIWKEGVYDKNGKWMDGWETRRKRSNGNDYLIIKLGKPGLIKNIDIDTSFFNGNQPEYISLEGSNSVILKNDRNVIWKKIIKKSKVFPNKNNQFKSTTNSTFKYIKLNIFPDGGIARLRLFGNIKVDSKKISKNKLIELSSILNGASIIATNNEHFGKAENILAPGNSLNMGDGWETRRRRGKGKGKGYDWVIVKFGIPGIVKSIRVGTKHFKGNYPNHCTFQSSYVSNSKRFNMNQSNKWKYLTKKIKLYPNKIHNIKKNIIHKEISNYIKLNIYPDGGISRIKIFGIKKDK